METLKMKRKIMIRNIRFPEWLSTDDKQSALRNTSKCSINDAVQLRIKLISVHLFETKGLFC